MRNLMRVVKRKGGGGLGAVATCRAALKTKKMAKTIKIFPDNTNVGEKGKKMFKGIKIG